MEVILLQKIAHLGNLGDKVKVKPGYGRNYLIPQVKAVPATEAKLAEFEQHRAELENAAAAELAAARELARTIQSTTVTIAQKAGDEGRLFGSIGTTAIAAAVTEAGIPIKKQHVRLPHGPLRQTGDFEIELQLHADVSAAVKVVVVPQE